MAKTPPTTSFIAKHLSDPLLAAKESPALFATIATNGTFQTPYHLQILNNYLLQVAKGEIKRLIITMPPRHGKTLFTSIYFPVWWLCNNPNRKVIVASYGSRMLEDPAKLSHAVFEEWAPQVFGLHLDPKRAASMDWSIKGHLGGMYWVGRKGSLTGKGASLFIIDDPIKDRSEANNANIRENIWLWYTQVARTRLEPDGAIIVILTRWHEDDLAGRLLYQSETGGEQWTLLNMPAIAEEDESFELVDPTTEIVTTRSRNVGEPLWPDRFSLTALAATRHNVGEYGWASLYQQHPVPLAGGFFRESWIQYYEPENCPDLDVIIQSWDTAATKSSTSDFVVGQVWGRTGADFYLLDQVRDRWDFDETVEAMKAVSRTWPESSSVIIEAQTLGASLASHLKKQIPGVIPLHVKQSKDLRALSCIPSWQSKNVYLPNPDKRPWVREYVRELLNFPEAANDDQVDATTLALNQLRGALFPNLSLNTPVSEKQVFPNHEYMIGWIPARLDDDFTVAVYDINQNEFVRFARIPAEPIDAQISNVFQISSTFHLATVRVFDGFDDALTFGAELKGAPIEKVKMNQAKMAAAYENLSQLLRQHLIDMPEYPELMAELNVFRSADTYTEAPDYTTQIAQQSGINALVLCTYDIDPSMFKWEPDIYANFDFEVV